MVAQELTLTARTITAAHTLARRLTVNQLAVAILRDHRAPALLTAPTTAPNRPARGKQHVSIMVGDYLRTLKNLAEVTTRGVEARVTGNLTEAARLDRRAAALNRILHDPDTGLEAAIRRESTPSACAGHATAYRVTVPAVQYVSPTYGLHAVSDALTVTVDTVDLHGVDLLAFLAFRRDFPASGDWPLWRVDPDKGLNVNRRHAEQADAARAVLGIVLNLNPHALPLVRAVGAEKAG